MLRAFTKTMLVALVIVAAIGRSYAEDESGELPEDHPLSKAYRGSPSEDFRLEAKPIVTIQGGPVLLEVTHTYTGTKSYTIEPTASIVGFFGTLKEIVPAQGSWKRRKFAPRSIGTIPLTEGRELNSGDTLTRLVFAHHGFEGITEGKVLLDTSWTLYPYHGIGPSAPFPIVRSSNWLEIDVLSPDTGALDDIINNLRTSLESGPEKWGTMRKKVFVGMILWTDHEELIDLGKEVLALDAFKNYRYDLQEWLDHVEKAKAEQMTVSTAIEAPSPSIQSTPRKDLPKTPPSTIAASTEEESFFETFGIIAFATLLSLGIASWLLWYRRRRRASGSN